MTVLGENALVLEVEGENFTKDSKRATNADAATDMRIVTHKKTHLE